MPAQSQRYKSADDYILENVDGEVLLYHPVNETMVYCNATAAYVWGLCDGVRTVDEIVDLFSACYPENVGDIVREVRGTVAELSRRGVLMRVDDAAQAMAGGARDLRHSSNVPRTPASGG